MVLGKDYMDALDSEIKEAEENPMPSWGSGYIFGLEKAKELFMDVLEVEIEAMEEKCKWHQKASADICILCRYKKGLEKAKELFKKHMETMWNREC